MLRREIAEGWYLIILSRRCKTEATKGLIGYEYARVPYHNPTVKTLVWNMHNKALKWHNVWAMPELQGSSLEHRNLL